MTESIRLSIACCCAVLLALAATGCATFDAFALRSTAVPPGQQPEVFDTGLLAAQRDPALPAGNLHPAGWPDYATPSGWPLDHDAPRVISEFGPRGRRMHNGIDIKAPRNTEVVATADGTVRLAGWLRGYGRVVYIDHGAGVETRYAHMSAVTVRPGDPVRRGDPIGRLGSTGRTTTHHIHYEVRLGGDPVDPAPFITGPEAQANAKEY